MKERFQSRITLSMILLVVGIGGCEEIPSPNVGPSVIQGKVEVKETQAINFSSVTTVGNRSYVPLNLMGNAAKNHQTILNILKKFEDEKKVEITNWKISDRQFAHTTQEFTYGLWIDHKPR